MGDENELAREMQWSASMYALQLNPNHAWKAAPGCRILIVDGGAVRFDFPSHWVVISSPRYVCVVDRYPPHERSLLAVSWRRVPIAALGVPLAPLIAEAASVETRMIVARGEAQSFLRPPLEAAWVQMRVFDSNRGHEVCTRVCLARADCTQALMVFDFSPEDEVVLYPVWDTLLKTLVVGDYIDDPSTGKRRAQRG